MDEFVKEVKKRQMAEIEIGKFDMDVLKGIAEEILADPTYRENVTELNDEEIEIFNLDVYDLLRLDMKERTVDMVYAKYNKAFLFAAMRAKQMLASSFTGSDGTAGYGVSRIRPEHVVDKDGTVTGNKSTMESWESTPTDKGWQDHVGKSGSELKITKDDFGTMVIVGVGTYLANPNISAYKFVYQGSEKAVQYLEPAFRNSELQVYNLSNPILYTRDEELRSRAKVVTKNQPIEPFWVGLSFAKISWLRTEEPELQ